MYDFVSVGEIRWRQLNTWIGGRLDKLTKFTDVTPNINSSTLPVEVSTNLSLITGR